MGRPEFCRHKRKGNPNFGKPGLLVPLEQPTRFELEQLRLKLSDEQVPRSKAMREWAKRYRHTYFVPEALLKFWGLDVAESEVYLDTIYARETLPGVLA